MHPALIAAMATFGVQKLRGKSTSRALRDSLFAAGATYGVTEIGAGIEALGSNTAAANLQALKLSSMTPEASAALQMEPFIGSASNVAAGSNLANLGPLSGIEALSPIAEGTKDFLGSTGEFGQNIAKAYKSGIGKFEKLDPITQFAIKYGTAPTLTALLTPDQLPKGMSYDEFMKLDSETRARLLKESRENVKGLGDKAQPLRTQSFPYDYTAGNPLYTFNQGGIVSVLPKYAQGGINYLPSKTTHDENDVHNYIRATGYVEDGSGTGNKDEDTILAQLADGEFVSRSDAVLGAGIMAGASPSNMKDMRAKGASFFYEQQARFKRIFDLLDASRKIN